MKNILFVCTGNTCRSPMAEGLFNKKAELHDLLVKASSCGLSAFEGMPASANAVKAMESLGIDISEHKASMISEGAIRDADLVLTMTYAHKSALLAHFKEFEDKIFTLYEYSKNQDGDVADPYGGNLAEYEDCRDEIDNLLENIIKRAKTIE